jgi:hypothetical protein
MKLMPSTSHRALTEVKAKPEVAEDADLPLDIGGPPSGIRIEHG